MLEVHMSDTDGVLVGEYTDPGVYRLEGDVLWFRDDLGYGFILCDEDQYFVHFSQIEMDGFKTLEAGAKVSFEADWGPRGPFCKGVQVIP